MISDSSKFSYILRLHFWENFKNNDETYYITCISRISFSIQRYKNSIMTFYDRAVHYPGTTIRELAFRTIFQIVSALDGHPITPGIVIIARSRYTIAPK